MFASKVWLSELEHQRAGWIRQQQTACRSEWAGCQLHPSRGCNQHQSCAPAGQIGEQWSATHSFFDLVSMESGVTARDLGINPFGEPYTGKRFCGFLYISDIQATRSGKSLKWRCHLPDTLLAASEHCETEVCPFPNDHGTSFDSKQLCQVSFRLG